MFRAHRPLGTRRHQLGWLLFRLRLVYPPKTHLKRGAEHDMGLLDKLRGELVDIVEWIDDGHHTLSWRFPRYRNQIKNGAQLVVRPGQVAVLVHQGKMAESFQPGHHTLSTQNLPILGTLQGWRHGFDSPFMSEVYFVSTRPVTDLKWGTPNPVMLRDADFGPIRLRAFGTYTLRAVNPKALVGELVGTDGEFETEEIATLLRSLLVEAFTDLIGRANIAALDLAARYRELSSKLQTSVLERLDQAYGLDVPQVTIVNISLPPEVEHALDTRASMGVVGDMNRFQQFQWANAVANAAQNSSGGAAASGMGLGLGFAMANQATQTVVPAPPAWHLSEGGVTSGPFPSDQIAAAIRAGRLAPTTFAWRAGMNAWLPASQVAELASHFGALAGPPPPPPFQPPAPPTVPLPGVAPAPEASPDPNGDAK